tara:strand:+ start:1005 stop:1403 length:399 start_codon:yes stop_codon:yes gene_type:complete
MNKNIVLLAGRIGQDPEVRETAGGKLVSFSLATSETWKGKDGTKQEKTQWHRCKAWGRTADFIAERMSKGAGVFVEGTIEYGEYTTKDGEVKKTTDIKVHRLDVWKWPETSGAGARPAQAHKAKYADDDIPF